MDTAFIQGWVAPYPRGTPDTILVGDFAPIDTGYSWTYYEHTGRSAPVYADEDTQSVARVDVRVLSVRASDSGRFIRIGFSSAPRYRHCSLVAQGKRWDWDEPAADTSAKVWEREYLELSDAFLVRNPKGNWMVANEVYGPRYHRYRRSDFLVVAGKAPYDTLFEVYASGGWSGFARNVGLVWTTFYPVNMNTSVGVTLVSFRGRVLDDSLLRELTRSLVPKDSHTGKLTLDGISASMPSGFCDLPGPSKIDDPDLALAEYTEIKAGNTWEYLGTNDSSSSGSWYASGSKDIQGLVRFSITETQNQGACTLFSFAEMDSLFRGEQSSYSPVNGSTSRTVPGYFSMSSGFGVKRGPDVLRWSTWQDSVRLDTVEPGLGMYLWPFGSGKAWVAVGDSVNKILNVYSLRYRTTPIGNRLVYRMVYNPGVLNSHSELTQGVGLSFADYNVTEPPNFMRSSRELFAFNGDIVDPAVKARYDSLSLAPP